MLANEEDMTVAVNEIFSLSFKGRASRGAYWRTLLALSALAAAGLLPLGSFSGFTDGSAAQKGLQLFMWGWWLFLAAFLVSAVVRRLHDISYGAVAAIFLIVPGLQIIVLVILGLMPGKKGLNRFGPDPLAVMTVRDAAPVRRAPRAEPSGAAREVRETLEGEIVEPGPDLKGTVVRERVSAEAEGLGPPISWPRRGRASRRLPRPEQTRSPPCAPSLSPRAARDASPSPHSCAGCRSWKGFEAQRHALEQIGHRVLSPVSKREAALCI